MPHPPFYYQNIAEIDQHRLDYEWLRQPQMYVNISLELAEARSELDTAKNQISVTEAELDRDIRINPSKYGIDKLTEGAIKAAILTAKKMKVAQAAFLEAKYEVDMMQAAQTALEHRKEALKHLTTLFLNEYYGTGPGSVRASDAREIRAAQVGEVRSKGQTTDMPTGKRKFAR